MAAEHGAGFARNPKGLYAYTGNRRVERKFWMLGVQRAPSEKSEIFQLNSLEKLTLTAARCAD
jgi:hypothetical protein